MFGPRMSEKDGFQAVSIARKTPLHRDYYPETRLRPVNSWIVGHREVGWPGKLVRKENWLRKDRRREPLYGPRDVRSRRPLVEAIGYAQIPRTRHNFWHPQESARHARNARPDRTSGKLSELLPWALGIEAARTQSIYFAQQ
jgi:hypothetical protein